MKKNVLFLIPMIVVAVLLFMLEKTGMMIHITVSVVGLVLLVAYTVVTKKEWKCTVLEVIERVFYAVALITGAALMNVHGVAAIKIVHKASAALFVVVLLVAEIHKFLKK